MDNFDFLKEMLNGIRTVDHPGLVCPKCGSKRVVVLKAVNSVIGCGDCGHTEELLTSK